MSDDKYKILETWLKHQIKMYTQMLDIISSTKSHTGDTFPSMQAVKHEPDLSLVHDHVEEDDGEIP